MTMVMLVATSAICAAARELPIRAFTTVDGLADDRVNRIVLDSRGLLWMCTNSGISRFDGSQFQNFGVAEGLPFPIINDLVETPDGDLWLASNGAGVIRLHLSPSEPRFAAFRVAPEPTANRINRLFRTEDGVIWIGTDGGLFRMVLDGTGSPAFTRVGLRRQGHPDEMVQVWSFASDREHTLWVGTRFGLVRLLSDGRMASYPVKRELETDHVYALLYVPGDDALWIAHQSGLAIFNPPAVSSYDARPADPPVVDDAIARAASHGRPLQDGDVVLPPTPGAAVYFNTVQPGESTNVSDVQLSSSGAVRVLTSGALFEFAGHRIATLDDPRLHAALLYAAEDRDGNLWVAVRAAGIVRIARHGFITFREADGLGLSVASVFEDRAGELVAISQDWRVSRFDGARFTTVQANVPTPARRAGWAVNQKVLEDRGGDWWFASGAGLVRFSGIRRIEDLATRVPTTYTVRDGLAQDSVNRLFEDSRGDIWIASHIPGREVLTRWDRATGRFQRYSADDGLPPFNAPTGFYEDPRHALFITLRDGGLVRHDEAGFRVQSVAEGLPAGAIGGAMGDASGRMWCWGSSGVYRIDDPGADRLRAVIVATSLQAHGGTVGALVADAAGDLYVTTAKGIARFERAFTPTPPAIPRVTGLYTTNDGLAGTDVNGAYLDRHGRLWFSTTHGLSYYEPRSGPAAATPRVRLAGWRVGGIEQPASAAGEDRLSGLELAPGRSQLEISFFGISFALGDTLAYEYRLVGASDEWSAPSPVRSVMFSNLAAGSYRFEVRAVSASGERSPEPARASFRVLPPIWRRWWFISIAALIVLGPLVGFERYRAATQREIARAREQRLEELEQVRRRIAADLHDEIGSSLTQISILSEVARQQGVEAMPQLSHPLAVIATSSRELVDAMSDIVWAINPTKDHLVDLTQRMRRHAADTFTATNIAFRLELPSSDHEIALGANFRREIFLIFKEAVNNIVKHSWCREVMITVALDGATLRLELHDNGRGFDPGAPHDGHGLASLRNRAAALGGTLTIVSAPGQGASVRVDLPIPT